MDKDTVKSVSEIPTLALLYRSQIISPTTTPRKAYNASYNSKIALIRYDITRLAVDSIVNAANPSLLGGGGVDGAIHRAAGSELLKACENIGGCDVGSAEITDGYKLPASKVIHAVGPIYWKEKVRGRHEPLLRGCYRRSLELAEENSCKSIAFSAISTGVYGYPSPEAAEHAISEVRNYLDEGKGESLEKIIFCNFLPKDETAYKQILPLYFPPEGAEPEIYKETEAKSGSSKAIDKFDDTESGLDSDWVEVDKDTIPKKVSVEDVAEEEGKSR